MIEFDEVSKIYHGRQLRKQVLEPTSFTLPSGDALGVCGANGAGKSTLLRLIAGVEHPSGGRVRRAGTVSWPIGYTSCFQSSLLDFVEDFARLEEYFHQPVKTYSAGMRARLAFGISLAVDFDCYLVDEVTGAGDERFRARCHEALVHRRRTGALVMVSHSAETLREYCRRGAVLHAGRIAFYDTVDEAIEVHHARQRAAA